MGGAPRLPTLSSSQRVTLERWSRGRRIPYRLVIRSRIILRASTGLSNRRIARELGVSPLTVACWRSRFALLGLDGISRDAPRLGGRRTLSDSKFREILATTLHTPPPSGTTWTSRSLARAVGVSHSTVLRVWKAHTLQRHRTRLSALAHDPRFQPRSIGVSGVYLSLPYRAVVLSDRAPETSRTHPRLPPASPIKARATPRASTRPVTELVELLARLESFPTARSPGRLGRKEFLAFLGSVEHHLAPGGRSHFFLAPEEEPLRSVVVQGSSRKHEVSLVGTGGDISLHELVGRWLSERSRNPRTEIVLNELPRLRQAVDRWASDLGGEARPFAWVNGRQARGVSPNGGEARSSRGTVA